jgi:hypothetical protein
LSLALLGVIAATMVTTASAGPVAPYDMKLGVEARWALNAAKLKGSSFPTKQVYVRCYRDDVTFNAAAAWRFGEDVSHVWAYTLAKSKTVYMRGSQCGSAHDFIRKLRLSTTRTAKPWEVGAYATLLHEALHVQGYKKERLTQCAAIDSLRWAAWADDIPMREANRLGQMAFAWSARNVSQSYYENPSVCQAVSKSADWTYGIPGYDPPLPT